MKKESKKAEAREDKRIADREIAKFAKKDKREDKKMIAKAVKGRK